MHHDHVDCNSAGLQAKITGKHWFELMAQYARAHTRSHVLQPSDEHGSAVLPHPWIGEDIHPDLGYWIARDYMFRYPGS